MKLDFTLTLQTCTEEKRARAKMACAGASLAVLAGNRFAMLGFTLPVYGYFLYNAF